MTTSIIPQFWGSSLISYVFVFVFSQKVIIKMYSEFVCPVSIIPFLSYLHDCSVFPTLHILLEGMLSKCSLCLSIHIVLQTYWCCGAQKENKMVQRNRLKMVPFSQTTATKNLNTLYFSTFLWWLAFIAHSLSRFYSRKFPLKQGVSAYKMVCRSLLHRSEAGLFCFSGYAQSQQPNCLNHYEKRTNWHASSYTWQGWRFLVLPFT